MTTPENETVPLGDASVPIDIRPGENDQAQDLPEEPDAQPETDGEKPA